MRRNLIIPTLHLEYNLTKLGIAIDSVLLVCSLLLLAANEGFQVGALMIQGMDVELHVADKGFPRTASIHRLLYPIENGKTNSRMKKLFIGQSFLVVSCSFLIAQLTTFEQYDAKYCFNSYALATLLSSGFPGIFITVCTAQLLPSVIAREYPREFLNIPGIYWFIRLALAIETTGVVQFLYLLEAAIQKVFCFSSRSRKLRESYTAAPVSEAEDALRSQGVITEEVVTVSSKFDYFFEMFKYFYSSALTLSSLAFIGFCLSSGYSTFKASVAIQCFILSIALVVIFYCEGVKVAVVSNPEYAVTYTEGDLFRTETNVSNRYKIGILLRDTPDGVERFLLGRQQIVVPFGFLVAQITHFGLLPMTGFPPFLKFILVGFSLPAVLVMLQFSQLAPQLLAESNNDAFLSLPGAFSLVYAALTIEKLGVTYVTTLIIGSIKKIRGTHNKGMPVNPTVDSYEFTTVTNKLHMNRSGPNDFMDKRDIELLEIEKEPKSTA
jgi:hypothetical protein